MNWFGSRRRERLRRLSAVAARTLPVLPQWEGMSSAERSKLIEWTSQFCYQKIWEGCQGLKLSDSMIALIAGHGLVDDGLANSVLLSASAIDSGLSRSIRRGASDACWWRSAPGGKTALEGKRGIEGR